MNIDCYLEWISSFTLLVGVHLLKFQARTECRACPAQAAIAASSVDFENPEIRKDF